MTGLGRLFKYDNPLRATLGAEFFRAIPREPGVYFMLDDRGEPLYIGKAKDLRARLQSYARARPGTAEEHTLEMIEYVRQIRWKICTTEQKALLLERDLLHSVRPPYNIADTWEESYLFIGLRFDPVGEDRVDLHFRLTSREFEDGYRLFGCYRHRRKVKTGYTALLRMIYAATYEKSRFSYPAKITRDSPAWNYSMRVPAVWLPELERFLEGRNLEFPRLLVDRMLSNEHIPAFMYPSIQDDIELLKTFYQVGPRDTYRLRTANKCGKAVVSHALMDQLIVAGVGELSTVAGVS